MTKTRWIIFAVICLVVFGLVIFLNKQNSPTFSGDASKIITEGAIQDHVWGSHDQKVVLVEYGDYQCPACGKMYQPVKDLTDKYGDKLTFVFRNFPLTSIHPNALAAATAAEAAGLQGKYIKMHDALYEDQQGWTEAKVEDRTTIFADLAKQAGVSNIDKFKTDLSDKSITDKINRDRKTGTDFGADATPTFVLNGKKLPTDVGTDADKLKKAVEDALKQAGYKL